MGIGFTLDTPARLARYGLGSCISLVDDVLIEQVRQSYCEALGEPYEPIGGKDPDARARRITAYLNLLQRLAIESFETLRRSDWDEPTGIRRYIELLPSDSPLRALRQRLLAASDEEERLRLDAELRASLTLGPIEANIMTKLDRAVELDGGPRPDGESDAVAAMRGVAKSELRGALVLSAGMNVKLFAAMSAYEDFFPTVDALPIKRVILKVSDYRSALVQGKLLARRGIWVAEYRIESGLNCGGHAFPTEGVLMGPILEEFKARRPELEAELFPAYAKAIVARGLPVPTEPPPYRVTIQGGIGTAAEDALLREHFGMDGTGWATPFLMVREVANVSQPTFDKLVAAGPEQFQLTWGSPIGVPFWTLTNSESEVERRRRVALGRPGSACPKHFIALNHEFGEAPLCRASRAYQRRKLQQLETNDPAERLLLEERITAPQCICHDLGGDVKRLRGIESNVTPAICPGPGARFFRREMSLDELVGHIYGRCDVLAGVARPHQFVNELALYIDFLEEEIGRVGTALGDRTPKSFKRYRENLRDGIRYYREISFLLGEQQATFEADLTTLELRLEALCLPAEPMGSAPPTSSVDGPRPAVSECDVRASVA